MPLALASSPEAEELSPTDCSEDSIDIGVPRGIVRPKPKVAAASVPGSLTATLEAHPHTKRKLTSAPDLSPADEKKRRIENLHNGGEPFPVSLLHPLLPPYGAMLYPNPLFQNDLLSLQRWFLNRHDPDWGMAYNPALFHPQRSSDWMHPAALPAQLQRPLPFYPPQLAHRLGSHPVLPFIPPLYTPLHPLYPATSSAAESSSKEATPPSLPATPALPVAAPALAGSPPPPAAAKSAPQIKAPDEEPISLVPIRRCDSSAAEDHPAPVTKSELPVKKRSVFLSVETLLNDSAEAEPVRNKEENSGFRPVYREPSKSYKNLTRERRMQANARERTRVHTISAAFENLRRAVPSFSHGQKLSKLSILRVATSYIMALGKLADDEQENCDELSLEDCVDLCTKTLMTEGQMRRSTKREDKVADNEKFNDDP